MQTYKDVWNPWVRGAMAMSDFDDDEYRTMICVQPGWLDKRYVVKPSQSVKMAQCLTFSN